MRKRSRERTIVQLNEPLPVHITYLTAWVDADTVNFRKDIYNHDGSSLPRSIKSPSHCDTRRKKVAIVGAESIGPIVQYRSHERRRVAPNLSTRRNIKLFPAVNSSDECERRQRAKTASGHYRLFAETIRVVRSNLSSRPDF